MSERALMVLTAKSRETITEDGGTSEWVLRPGVVRNFKYAVCTRNAHRAEDTGTGPAGPEPHGTGFLVGRISDVQKVGQGNGRNRFIVTFDATAEIDIALVWDGSRNPVRYVDVSYLEGKGIHFDKLSFMPLKTPKKNVVEAEPPHASGGEVAPLTIAQAKLGLASKFGVSVDAIEIRISG